MDQCFYALKYNIYPFMHLKPLLKYEILNNYVDRCYEANCVTCHIVAQR